MATLSPANQSKIKNLLEQERARLQSSIGRLSQAEKNYAADEQQESDVAGDLSDVASDLEDQTIDLSLEQEERYRLEEVDAALNRLADGTYGTCERGGEEIPVERLLALPWTRTCVTHASEDKRV